jgi:16S rRNA U516 pseudouridylate synthase RsuA-like enzyme
MFQVMGSPVDKLRRVKIGALEDKKLHPGEWRFLTESEVQAFQDEFAKKKTPKKHAAHTK